MQFSCYGFDLAKYIHMNIVNELWDICGHMVGIFDLESLAPYCRGFDYMDSFLCWLSCVGGSAQVLPCA